MVYKIIYVTGCPIEKNKRKNQKIRKSIIEDIFGYADNIAMCVYSISMVG